MSNILRRDPYESQLSRLDQLTTLFSPSNFLLIEAQNPSQTSQTPVHSLSSVSCLAFCGYRLSFLVSSPNPLTKPAQAKPAQTKTLRQPLRTAHDAASLASPLGGCQMGPRPADSGFAETFVRAAGPSCQGLHRRSRRPRKGSTGCARAWWYAVPHHRWSSPVCRLERRNTQAPRAGMTSGGKSSMVGSAARVEGHCMSPHPII